MLEKLFVFAVIFLSSCGHQAPVQHTEFVLGTTVTLTFYDGDRPELWYKVLEDFTWLDDEMTIWDREKPSRLMEVNSTAGSGVWAELSNELTEVLSLSLEFGKKSYGALDITLGPVVKVWGVATDHPRVPSEEQLAQAMEKTGLESVRLVGSRLMLDKPGMILDLGAVAKGWEADRIASMLKAEGVNSAIVDLGGNVLLLGDKPDGTPWKVGIQDPLSPRGDYLGFIATGPVSVVTSGIYERYFEENGIRYHHIFNPKTGLPVENNLASVSIVHPSSTIADALSTSCFVLGLEQGRILAENEGAETIFVTRDRRVWVSPGLREKFTLTSENYTEISEKGV